MDNDIRLLKWVGEPAILMEDRMTVVNWKHENNRAVATLGSVRVCRPPKSPTDKQGTPGLSKTYRFGAAQKGRRRAVVSDLTLPVDALDAEIIMRVNPDEFIDVTNHPNPNSVVNEPYIVKQKPDGKFYKFRTSPK